jgi:DNA repair ATPase RecN
MTRNEERKPKGLSYMPLDLHVHTPASKDDYQDKGASPSDIVDTAISKGLAGICITDHNTAEWVDKIAKAAEGKPLAVFPGVEISITGGKEGPIHIVGVFDPTQTAQDLNDLLSEIGLVAANRGFTDQVADGDPNQVIDAIAKHGGLPILAHADSSHGVLHDMKGQPRIKVLQNPRLLAAEISSAKYRKFLDGKDADYQRELPTYEASDAHKPSDIGANFTYFKVQALSLENLKQCFYDDPVRIRRRDQYTTAAIPRIKSVTISKGFFGGEQVLFHDGLNTLIGGQGVGKSLLVEFLRFALDQTSTISPIVSDTQGKLAKQLGPGGEIEVHMELANGTGYRVVRTYDGVDNPLTVTNLETNESFHGDLASLFPIVAYSQTEAVHVARDPDAQRDLIDRFIDAPRFQRPINEVLGELCRNDQELLKVLDARDQLSDVKRDLSTIDEEINNLEKSLQTPIFEQMKRADQHKAAFEAEREYHDSLLTAVAQFDDQLSVSYQPRLLTTDLVENESLKRANDLSGSSLEDLRAHLGASTVRIKENSDAITKILDQWMPHFDKVSSRYHDFLAKAGGDQQQLELKRKNLVKQRRDLQKKVEDLEARSQRLAQTLVARNGLLDQLDQARTDFFEARRHKYDELTALSKDKLRLQITPAANTQAFSAALEEMATGTRIRKSDLAQLAGRVSPRDFMQLVLKRDLDTLAIRGAITRDTAESLVGWLRSLPAQEKVLALQHQYPLQDVPSIQFKKDDSQYYDISDVSTGQKCTALLIIGMSSGTSPIIVDQPEESVDIAFVYNDIVSTLRSGKEHRQFILTTHNPNIAVTADSDLLHVLKGSATHGTIVHTGAIDDSQVRAEAIQHLEGGKKPYLLRGKKYGLID